MAAGYLVNTDTDVALTPATAKTVASVIGAANQVQRITGIGVSFDGTSATAEPVTVELVFFTTDGTGTAFTIRQIRGPDRTVQATAKVNYTVEPTVPTVRQKWLVHPQSGITVFWPFGRESELEGAGLIGVRCTAPAAVNVTAWIEFEEG